MNDKRCKHCNGKFFKLDSKHWVMKSGKLKCKKQALKTEKLQKIWNIRNKDKRREYLFKSKYGISLKEYNAIFTAQEGKCALCFVELDKCDLDHDHKTGRVRGILCRPCNLGLGMLKDDPEILLRAAQYVTTKESALYQKMVI